jgi:hypothetical protein
LYITVLDDALTDRSDDRLIFRNHRFFFLIGFITKIRIREAKRAPKQDKRAVRASCSITNTRTSAMRGYYDPARATTDQEIKFPRSFPNLNGSVLRRVPYDRFHFAERNPQLRRVC